MTDKEAQDRAAKNRIITHMNKDHHDSIIRFLEHYGNMSSHIAFHGKMTDIELNKITLVCRGQICEVSLEPPMTSYSEARQRAVELDRDCRRALGQSDVTIREFLPPYGSYTIPFCVLSATFLGYSQRWWFEKGQVVDSLFGSGFAKVGWAIQPWLFWGLALAHGVETIYFARYKLRKHSVNVRSSIWWMYVASCFIEGQFMFKRFDNFVEAQAQKQKH